MKPITVYQEVILRIEGTAGVTRDQIANLLKSLFGSQTKIAAISMGTSSVEVRAMMFHSSHIIND